VRLLAYTDAAGVGGAEISLSNLLGELQHDPSLDITVLGCLDEVVRRVVPGPADIPGPAGTAGAARVDAVVAPVRRHPALLARLRPDVVHANLPVPWAAAVGIGAALALPRTRVLAVQQLPLRTVELPVWLRTRALLRRLDAHVAVGRESCRTIENFYALGRGSVRSIPNFVPDLSVSSQAVDPMRAHPPRSECSLTIGSLGRLDRVKGYDLLLAALVALPQARLVVLGDGGERAALERQARELGVADRVQLPGWDPDPRRRLPEWDVFCLPSRSEGFPLSIVEAMLAGLPVVATRVGSVAEAVQDGRTGLLVEKDDVDGLVAALGELTDPVRRRELGDAARAHAAEHFTVGAMAAAYRDLYTELLARPRRPRLRPPAEKP
jgi:glycosyltransferase involved in cell wall biosynthesis